MSVLLWCALPAQAALRDPTQPLAISQQGQPKWPTLHSVLISKQRRVAIIDGITVREGQPVPSAKQWVVKQIQADAVIVANRQQQRRLELVKRANAVKTHQHKTTPACAERACTEETP
jgi:MSHA biogenesis protein MshK